MDIPVSDWDELIQRLYDESWKPQLGRFRSNFAFRGMQSAGKDLTTSLFRLGGQSARNEPHLLRNFRKYAHRDASLGQSVWDWLSLAQHHGLPTRMLDWTSSPFVALHFVTQDVEHFDRDGIVWCIDYVKCHELLPTKLRELLACEQADVFTSELLDQVATTLTELDALSGDGEPFVLFIDPPSLDDRIVNQFALLSLMSSGATHLHEWLQHRPELYRRIIIPAKLKWEVRDKLDQANITERVLFPGLDGLTRWLKRYYSPHPNSPDASQDPADKIRDDRARRND